MTCEKCRDIPDRKDIPHVVRKCEKCGRKMYVHEPGKHGLGFKVKKGEKLVIPRDFLRLSLDPTKSTGYFTRDGLNWYAQQIFIEEFPRDKTKINDELQKIEDKCDAFLKKSEFLEGLDIENPNHTKKIIELLGLKKDTTEWWAFLTGTFLAILSNAREKNDIDQAIWAVCGLERFRSMFVFKEHLESVVWMGQSAKKVVDILRTWDNNIINSDEEFWQTTFNENSYVLSQVFAVPIIFIKDKAYVGGMNIDRKEGKLVDYLYSIESSREAVLIEIKTPMTRLLGSKYRGIYKPSAELTGAIMQVLDYRIEINQKIKDLVDGTQYDISAFNPRCAIIVGNGMEELKEEAKRRSFELFRSNLKDVEVVTYDELFRKVEILASLFKLIRTKKTNNKH